MAFSEASFGLTISAWIGERPARLPGQRFGQLRENFEAGLGEIVDAYWCREQPSGVASVRAATLQRRSGAWGADARRKLGVSCAWSPLSVIVGGGRRVSTTLRARAHALLLQEGCRHPAIRVAATACAGRGGIREQA